MQKILLIGTGGTIGCKSGSTVRLDAPLKILDFYKNSSVAFTCASPFSMLSENMDFTVWAKLLDFLNSVDFDAYCGVILLHGSDTLAYTGALLAHLFFDRRLVLVAADRPPENPASNALPNLDAAVRHLVNGKETGVFISYNGLFPAYSATDFDCRETLTQADVPFIPVKDPAYRPKHILVIRAHPGIEYTNYTLAGTDAVLHTMYHSATAPPGAAAFCRRCLAQGVPFFFVTPRKAAVYESAADLENILFQTTTETAIAKILLTNKKDFARIIETTSEYLNR